jgi:GNAT superfamily N-acetyltransferase
MARFDEEVRTVRSIYNDAWSDNWGFVPMTEAEFAQLARNLKQIVDPRMAFLAEIDGEVVGFGVAIPNMNQVFRRIRNGRLLPTGLFKLLMADFLGGIQEVRLPLLGVRRAYHGRGIDAALILQFIEKVPPIGFPSCEMSWILESNPAMKNALEALGGVRDKEYALYEKDLGG